MCQGIDAISTTVEALVEVAVQKVAEWKTDMEAEIAAKQTKRADRTIRRELFKLIMEREGQLIIV